MCCDNNILFCYSQDAELPPIMEEEEHDVPLEFEQSLPEKLVESTREEVDGIPFNAERAIVLFKPVNSPWMKSESKYSFSVDSDIISGFKSMYFHLHLFFTF